MALAYIRKEEDDYNIIFGGYIISTFLIKRSNRGDRVRLSHKYIYIKHFQEL